MMADDGWWWWGRIFWEFEKHEVAFMKPKNVEFYVAYFNILAVKIGVTHYNLIFDQ